MKQSSQHRGTTDGGGSLTASQSILYGFAALLAVTTATAAADLDRWREWFLALGPAVLGLGAFCQFLAAQAELAKRALGTRAPVIKSLSWLFVLTGSVWSAVVPFADLGS